MTTHSWLASELASRLDIPEDEVHRRAFTLGLQQSLTVPTRFPIESLALLQAQKHGVAICRSCYRTDETEGPCVCKRGRITFLPEPEGAGK